MQYCFSTFILDTHRKIIRRKESEEIITNNERIIDALTLLVFAYPETVSKTEFIDKLWPENPVTEWALSRLIADIRQLLASYDSESTIIKTVHGKGFRLGIEIEELCETSIEPKNNKPELTDETQHPSNEPTSSSRKKYLFLFAVIFLLFLVFIGQKLFLIKNQNNWQSTEQLASAFDYPAPVNNWWSNVADAIEYGDNTIILKPTETMQKFGFNFNQPVLIQNARLSVTLSADQEFLNTDSVVQLFSQVINRGNWFGEWQCPNVKASELSDQFITLHCVIRAASEFWKQEKNEASQFGVLVKGDNIKGRIIIQSAKIHFPTSVNLDKEWKPSPVYNRGVSYSPIATNDSIHRTFIGPRDLRKNTVIFTLKPDKEFVDSGASIQPYLYKVYEHNGMWECLIDNSQLNTSGFTFECPTLEDKDIFLFGEEDYLMIGVQPFGETIKGSIKIIGISILTPEEMRERRNTQQSNASEND